jgi:hypothetical protein
MAGVRERFLKGGRVVFKPLVEVRVTNTVHLSVAEVGI